MTAIEILHKNFDKAYLLLKAYLFNLAKNDPNANFWQQQINGTLSGYPQRTLQDLYENFLELAEKNETLSKLEQEAYAATQVTCCLLSLLEKETPPEENTLDALKTLHQALYSPGLLIPVTEDVTPELKNNIEIFEQDITYLVRTLSKVRFLCYIAENYDKIKNLTSDFPQLESNHVALLRLNISWLDKEYQQIKNISEKPHYYAKSTILPEIGGYIPFEALQGEESHSFWQSLWQTHLIIPWKLRFSIGRLHARFADQDYRVESYYSTLPNNYKKNSFFSQCVFYFCFWIHLCLVFHLFKSAYLQTTWHHIKDSFNYMRGSHSFFAGVPFALSLSIDLLKWIYAPLLLLTPILFGISSLPFLIMRCLSDKIPSYFLRTNFRVLLDSLETLKDISLILGSLFLLTPLISGAIMLPSTLAILGGIVSTFVCFILLLALTAVGLSPQILVLILGMGGYNKVVEIAFSPLISLGGVISILSFPAALAMLTLPRVVLEMAYTLQTLSLSSSSSSVCQDSTFSLTNDYDPVDELQLFVKNHGFLVQYEEMVERSAKLNQPSLNPQKEATSDKKLVLNI